MSERASTLDTLAYLGRRGLERAARPAFVVLAWCAVAALLADCFVVAAAITDRLDRCCQLVGVAVVYSILLGAVVSFPFIVSRYCRRAWQWWRTAQQAAAGDAP